MSKDTVRRDWHKNPPPECWNCGVVLKDFEVFIGQHLSGCGCELPDASQSVPPKEEG